MFAIQGYDRNFNKTKLINLEKDPFYTTDRIALASFEILKDVSVEYMLVFLLIKENIFGWQEVARGSESEITVFKHELFELAILSYADSIVIVHNHPSESVLPSSQDIYFTEKAITYGKNYGINILDHLVVAPKKQNYLSLISVLERMKT